MSKYLTWMVPDKFELGFDRGGYVHQGSSFAQDFQTMIDLAAADGVVLYAIHNDPRAGIGIQWYDERALPTHHWRGYLMIPQDGLRVYNHAATLHGVIIKEITRLRKNGGSSNATIPSGA